MERERHVPVLLKEALHYLAVKPGSTVVDCTLGLAGHSSEILRGLGPQGKLIAFDRDPQAMELAAARLYAVRAELGSQAPQVELIGDAFSSAPMHLADGSVDALLADFGVSSLQLDEATRGFSFMADGPLDMRMDTRRGETAEQVVNEASERELADLIYEYGEERRSRRIARAIVRGRPVTTTAQLAQIVRAAAPAMKQDRIHPATRTFQGLRIYVNRELDEIKSLMEAAPKLLKPSGRMAVISFHSLEDRIVKDSLREGAQKGIWTILTKKPVTAEEEEIERNPRSRSAKLRAAEKTGIRAPGIRGQKLGDRHGGSNHNL
ncbi:16S rRNA (cytosine(1402)-N(4))-methyltransferase RsmH [Occallatibacter riparius]|uniref:Ribosomal RNA small subunit methyltransferase H n=1 Tax=Occallatibacter riparius TaxID=1002689 RepID=A0A9J7BGJ4_9BACT|nr:16S rRNA (cytosine(1402)-N(4))-methyltransferase RsmH [Occallatibacter riparius]UWZ82100.1 16S rRNA (cytosine(1402)-N(4))-methyltransferase RsmH [Occallatibacter riparius]